MSSSKSPFGYHAVGKRRLARLTAIASSLGMTPERYLRQLIDEDLALDRKARSTTFADLMGAGREVDERELDRLVDAARTRHHKRVARSRR